jgi:hypothetical protein
VNTVLKRGRRSRRASLFAVIANGLVCHTTAHETQGPLNDDPRRLRVSRLKLGGDIFCTRVSVSEQHSRVAMPADERDLGYT